MFDTETLDDAMNASIAEIDTEDAAKTFIQTVISEFQDRFTIEDPDNVQKVIQPVVRALQGLQKKGFDMQPYTHQIVAMAASEFEHYSGTKDARAYRSTLIVADNVMHKKGTGYWKKEDKK